MEESISRLAGSYHGTRVEPEELVTAAHRAGRPAAERTTLYAIRRRYPAEETSEWSERHGDELTAVVGSGA
jgi:2-iminoacetate synthase ThiH